MAKVRRPRERQGELARWAAKRTKSTGKARRVGKRGTQTQREASWQDGCPNAGSAVTKRTKSRNENDHTTQGRSRQKDETDDG